MATRDVNDSVAGVIIQLQLKDFMCHSNLTLDLNPHINFVVGDNSSGKSAIMTAVMVVLGSKATDTGRGKTLIDFIKSGANQAKIKITLKNTGSFAYKPEAYGEDMIIVKTISKSGPRSYIQSVDGDLIHLPGIELAKILQAFSLKLTNPFALLTQETMRNICNHSEPSHMYELVKNGAGLKKAQKKTVELRKKLELMTNEKEKLEKELQEKKNDLDMWSFKFDHLAEISKIQAKLQDEAIWSQVIAVEQELSQYKRELKKYSDTRKKHQSRINAYQRRFEEIPHILSENEVKLASCKIKIKTKAAEKNKVNGKLERSKLNIYTLSRVFRYTCKSIQEEKNDKEFLEKVIKKYDKDTCPEAVLLSAQRRLQLEQMEAELINIKESKTTLLKEEGRLREEIRAKSTSIQGTRDFISSLKSKYTRQKKNLEQAMKQTGAVPIFYGQNMSILLEEVTKSFNQQKFSKKPIGPLGMCIKVKDKAWTLAIENFLLCNLQVFFCNCNEDRLLLIQICQSVMPRYRLQIVTSEFVERVFDVSRHRAVASGNLVNLMDMLEIKDPVVMNYFIDQKSVETVLLCPTSEEAMSIMCQRDRVPTRCRVMLTKDAEQVYAAPNYRFYSPETSHVKVLVSSKAASIRNEKSQIAEREARVALMERELRQLIETGKDTEIKLRKTSKRLRDQRVRELYVQRTVQELREKDIDDREAFTVYHEELEDMNAKIERLNEEKLKMMGKILTAKRQKMNIEAALKKLVTELNILEKNEATCFDLNFNLKHELWTNDNRTSEEREQHRTALMMETSSKNEVKRREKCLQEMRKETMKVVGIRIDTTRSYDEITREIEEINDSKLEDSFANFTARIKLLEEVLDLSLKVWKLECEVNDLSGEQAKESNLCAEKMLMTYLHIQKVFKLHISKQHFPWTIDFDHKNKEMSIVVKTKGKNREAVKNMSGGERSFATLCLILAVWDKLRNPFFMLDEFDFRMDLMNCHKCSNMLIDAAGGKKSHQFIFFTRKGMNHGANDNITIHELADPRLD